MKRKIIALFGILSIFCIRDVKASTFSAIFNCDRSVVNPGDTINCTLRGVSDEQITSVSGKIVLDSKLSLYSINTSSIWEGNGENGNIQLHSDSSKTGTFDIATFRVTISGGDVNGAKVSVNDLTFYTEIPPTPEPEPTNPYEPPGGETNLRENEVAHSVAVTPFSIRTASRNTNLATLTISEGTIKFNKNTNNYNIVIEDKTSFNISATVEDPASKVTGTGDKEIRYGNNSYPITVTSESGHTKVYTINVTRPDNRSTTNTLKSLKINGVSFDPEKEIELEFSYLKDKAIIKTELTDKDTSVYVDGYGDRTVELDEGINQILIKVRAENEVVRTYTITIKRAIKNESSENINLADLVIRNHEVNYVPGVFDYQVELGENEKRLSLSVVPENENAKFVIQNNSNLADGDMVVIKVTSADGTVTQDYRIKIIKKTSTAVDPDGPPKQEVVKEKSDLLVPILVFAIGFVSFTGSISYVIKRKKNQ